MSYDTIVTLILMYQLSTRTILNFQSFLSNIKNMLRNDFFTMILDRYCEFIFMISSQPLKKIIPPLF